MILSALPSGTSVFIDANIWVYHFQPHPVLGAACAAFLRRIDQQDLVGLSLRTSWQRYRTA